MTSKLEDKEYKNWILCTLGLQYMGDTIRPYLEEKLTEFHKKELLSLNHDVKNHGFQQASNPYRSVPNITFEEGTSPNNPPRYELYCNNCSKCELAFQKINQYLIIKPIKKEAMEWKNIQFHDIYKRPWALAQLFIPIGGHMNKTPDNTDALGMCRVIQNCRLFSKSRVTTQWKTIQEVCKYRNNLMHSVTNKVEDAEKENMFRAMKFILKMTHKSTTEVITELDKLSCQEMHISLMDQALELKIRELHKDIAILLQNSEADEEEIKQLQEAIKNSYLDLVNERKLKALKQMAHDFKDDFKHLIEEVSHIFEAHSVEAIKSTDKMMKSVLDNEQQTRILEGQIFLLQNHINFLENLIFFLQNHVHLMESHVSNFQNYTHFLENHIDHLQFRIYILNQRVDHFLERIHLLESRVDFFKHELQIISNLMRNRKGQDRKRQDKMYKVLLWGTTSFIIVVTVMSIGMRDVEFRPKSAFIVKFHLGKLISNGLKFLHEYCRSN